MSLNNRNIGLAKETALLFFVKIFGAVVAFVLQIVINRFLGTEMFGQLSKYLAIATVIITLINLGTNIGIVKKSATADSLEEETKYIWYSINVLIVVTLLIVIIYFVFRPYINIISSINTHILIFIFAYSVSFALSNIYTGYFQGKKKTLFANVLDIVCYNCFLIFGTIIISKISKTFNSLLIVYIISNILILTFKICKVVGKHKSNQFLMNLFASHDIKGNLDYVSMCVPFCLSAFCVSAQSMVMKLILDNKMGSFDVGVFRILETYVSCMALFVSPFITLWPYMAKAYKEDKMDELKNTYSNSVSIITLLALPTTVSMLICSKEVYAIFGLDNSTISGAYIALFFMMVSGAVDAIIGPAGALLNMTKYGSVNLIITISSSALCVGLSILLIPQFGLLGAAISNGMSRIITNVLTAIINYKMLKIWPYSKKLIMFILASVPLFYAGRLIYFFFHSSLMINIIIISIFEVIMFFILFSALFRDLTNKLIKSFMRKINK